jgi:hypothetical protein
MPVEAAFEPRSRTPKSSPAATASETVELVLRLRKQLSGAGLDAGADTISWHLAHHHATTVSRARINRILVRAGTVTPDPSKRPKSSYIRFQADQPNQTWQSDGRRDVRKHVVTGKEQLLLAIDVHKVATGVARRRYRTQRARAHRDIGRRIDPVVGVFPTGFGICFDRSRRQLGKKFSSPSPAKLLELAAEPNPTRFRGGAHAVHLAAAKGQPVPELAAQGDAERVVVAMQVRDQKPRDVGQAAAENRECVLELLARRRQRPTRIDQHETVGFGDGVHIDGAQPALDR